jgi:predicted metal-dependent phosphoesterase TrpH
MKVETHLLRADLHLHSYHSGYAPHFRFLRARDCYSEPEAVYRVAKARGMDLVTITDHDSIGGCLEFLERHPDADDFFISEEIECWFPDLPLKVHVGAYGITERIHAEAQRLCDNVYELTAYLRQEDVPFALNHMFFFFRHQIPVDRYLRAVLELFPAFEARNGAMLPEHNALIEEVVHGRVSECATGLLGGSDAHTLRRVGTTYTEAPGRTREAFLSSLRAGRTRVGGRHGTTLDIDGVIGNYWLTLAGLGRPDLSWPRRGIGLAWSLASLPVEFVPFLIGVMQKRQEAGHVARCRRGLVRAAVTLTGGGPKSATEASTDGVLGTQS